MRRPNIPPLMSLPLPTRVNRVRVKPEKTQRVLVPIPRAPASATVTAQNVDPPPPHSNDEEEGSVVAPPEVENPPFYEPIKYMEWEPSTEESSRLNERLEVWRKRIGEAKTPLDPIEFPQRVRRRDPQIGYPEFLAVEQLMLLQDEFLARKRTEETKSRPILRSRPRVAEVPSLARRKVCTEDPDTSRRPERVGKQPASASLSRNLNPEEDIQSMSFQALTATPAVQEEKGPIALLDLLSLLRLRV